MNDEPRMVQYLHSKARKNRVPLVGNFELTQNCNFSCPMCYVHENKRKDELPTEAWLSLAEQARSGGMLFLLLTGGEPFLRDDFETLYTALSEMGFLISVNTNGSLLAPYLPLLKRFPPFRINLSLYAAEREAYRRFCGIDAFERVTASVQALRESKIPVRLNSVFTAHNRGQAPQIVRFAKAHRLHLKSSAYVYPQIRLGVPCGENRARLTAFEAAACEFEADLERFGAAYRAKAQRLQTEEAETENADAYRCVRCRAGRSSFWVTWDGKMRACGMLPYPETYPLAGGFLPAWRELNEKVAEIRLPQECAVCKKRSVCPACAAMCFAESGTFSEKPSYFCDFFRRLCDLSGAVLTDTAACAASRESAAIFEEDCCDG